MLSHMKVSVAPLIVLISCMPTQAFGEVALSKQDSEVHSPTELTDEFQIPSNVSQSISDVFVTALSKELHAKTKTANMFNAGVALALGIVMLSQAEGSLHFLLLAGFFITGFYVTKITLEPEWSSSACIICASTEVGAAAVYVGHLSGDGIKALFVVLLGAMAGYKVMFWISPILNVSPEYLGIFIYTTLVGGAVFAHYRRLSVKGLIVVFSFFGGSLVTSALAYYITLAVTSLKMMQSFHPKEGAWVDFLELLIMHDYDDFGIFAGSPYNPEVGGATWKMDRLLGRFWWALFFAGGTYIQLKMLKKSAEAMKKPAPKAKAQARELPNDLSYCLITE